VKYVVFPLTQHVNTAINLFKAAGLKLETKKIEEPGEITIQAVAVLCEQLGQKDVSVRVE
jgi:hypothetical protein